MPGYDEQTTPDDEATGAMVWIRLNISESRELRYLFDADERTVWYELNLMAGGKGIKGWVSKEPGVAFTHEELAHQMRIDDELLVRALAKLERERLIHENGRGIQIINWKESQSHYTRQQKYRERQKEGQSPGRATATQAGRRYERCEGCGQMVNHCVCREEGE